MKSKWPVCASSLVALEIAAQHPPQNFRCWSGSNRLPRATWLTTLDKTKLSSNSFRTQEILKCPTHLVFVDSPAQVDGRAVGAPLPAQSVDRREDFLQQNVSFCLQTRANSMKSVVITLVVVFRKSSTSVNNVFES